MAARPRVAVLSLLVWAASRAFLPRRWWRCRPAGAACRSVRRVAKSGVRPFPGVPRPHPYPTAAPLLQNRGFAKCHRVGHMPRAVRHRQNRRSRSAENGREMAPGKRISQNLDFAATPAAERPPLGRGPLRWGCLRGPRGRRAMRRDQSGRFLVNTSRARRDGAGCEEGPCAMGRLCATCGRGRARRGPVRKKVRTRWGGMRRGPGAGGRTAPGASVRGRGRGAKRATRAGAVVRNARRGPLAKKTTPFLSGAWGAAPSRRETK